MENLNKDNTWNELEIQFPKEVNDFFDWIKGYKKSNNWDNLFNGNHCYSYDPDDDDSQAHDWVEVETKAPDFNQIPFAMQMGVIIAYFSEREVLNDTMYISCSNIPQFKKFLQDRFNLIKINNDLK